MPADHLLQSQDPLGGELDEIGVRIEVATGLPMTRDPLIVVEQCAPRLLAALHLTLDLYARYVSRDDYAAILAALTGSKEVPVAGSRAVHEQLQAISGSLTMDGCEVRDEAAVGGVATLVYSRPGDARSWTVLQLAEGAAAAGGSDGE